MQTWKGGSFFLFIASLALVFTPYSQRASGAPQDESRGSVPYRRVFIPQADLSSIRLEGYTPIAVSELEDSLKKIADGKLDISFSNGPMENESSRLVAAHYVAKLVGADLVSERSRFAMSRPIRSGERITVQPWSSAVHARNWPTSSNTTPWTFDVQGLPRVPVVRTEQDRWMTDPMNAKGEVVQWFGWSARSKANSQPNKLAFSLDVPRCTDSCLVLILPPRATVHDSATVARRLENWGDATARIGQWPESTRDPGNFTPTANAAESIWLIELGGVRNASFAISLGETERGLDFAGNDDAFRYTQMIRSQRLDHFFDGHEVRTVCQAELFISHKNPLPVRMKPAPGSRLRKLSVNGANIEWEGQKDWIQWLPSTTSDKSASEPVVIGAASAPNLINVYAEFVTPVQVTSASRLESPRIAFDRAYVMSGRTALHTNSPWRFNAVACPQSHFTDSSFGGRDAYANDIDLSWHGQPPECTVAIEQETMVRKCELFSRILVENQSVTAMVRARLHFLDQDTSQAALKLGAGWKLRSVEAVNRADPIVVDTSAHGEFQQLNWGRIVRSRVAEVDLQLVMDAPLSSEPPIGRQVDPINILQVHEFEQTHTFAVEDSGTFRLDMNESLLERMVPEDSIPDWQRRMLPRNSKPFVFRYPFVSIEHPRAVEDLKLNWVEKPDFHNATIATLLKADSTSTILVQHEFRLQLAENRDRLLEIRLPYESVRWTKLVDNHWVSLNPTENPIRNVDADAFWWRFRVDDPSAVVAIRATLLIHQSDQERVKLLLPKLSNTRVTGYAVKCPSRTCLVHSPSVQDQWIVDEDGFESLQIHAPNAMNELQVSIVPNSNQEWRSWNSELHVAVDLNGGQKCCLVLNTQQITRMPRLVIELESGWEPVQVRARTNRGVKPFPWELDGQRLILGSSDETIPSESKNDQECPSEIQIELVGPSLTPAKRTWSLSDTVVFQWPEFEIDAFLLNTRWRLWLPSELTAESTSRNIGSGHRWPIWAQTQSLVSLWVLDSGIEPDWNSDRSEIENNAFLKNLQIPWAGGPWRVVASRNDELSQTRKFLGRDGIPSIRIGRRGTCQTASLVLFVVMALLTPALIAMSSRWTIAASVAFILIAHVQDPIISALGGSCLVGMCMGFCVFAIYRMFQRKTESEPNASRRPLTRWAPWNVREEHSEAGTSHSSEAGIATADKRKVQGISTNLATLLVYMAIGVCIHQSPHLMGHAFGQIPDGEKVPDNYAIIIPVDESGNVAGRSVYIPDEMRNILAGRPMHGREDDYGTRPISARHILRFGGRGKADQLIMNYEFLVGDELSPVRFPFADQLLTLRFTVDNSEINPGVRLRRVASDWIWSPDKPGKKSIQVIGQPRITQIDATKDPTAPSSQQIDMAIIPVGSASIEIEVDPQLSVEVTSRGQVTNPSPGRYAAMLGAVDRLQCKVTAAANGVSNFPAIPGAGDGNESSMMHVELLLNHDSLQAKTIFEFPKGMSTTKQIEIEADAQWLPIGTDFGDAHWVELRPGSTLSRRRYVLEWNSSTAINSTSPYRRISIVWVPQSNQQDLNVLFSECRNYRTRFGNLKFSRVLGSDWSIEGVGNWTPALNADEKLDWIELKPNQSNPIATTLRIPFNGGIGILKHKRILDRHQARISSTWSIDPTGELLTSRIELVGNLSSDLIYFDLPAEFDVVDVTHRNETVRFLQRAEGGKVRVQLLADRASFDVGDIKIQAKRPTIYTKEKWRDIPWVELSPSIEFDQSLKLVASEQLALRIENHSADLLAGRGNNQFIASLSKSSKAIPGSSMALRYQVVHRDVPLKGYLVASVTQNGAYEAPEIELRGIFDRSIESKPSILIETPMGLKDRWQSDLQVNPIPCPDPSRVWLQVFFPESESIAPSRSTLAVRFFPSTENVDEMIELAGQVRLLGHSSISLFLATSDSLSRALIDWQLVASETKQRLLAELAIQEPMEFLEKRVASDSAPIVSPMNVEAPEIAISLCIHEVIASRSSQVSGRAETILESRYWIPNSANNSVSHGLLRWSVPKNVEILSVCSNGRTVAHSMQGTVLACEPILAGLCSEVVLTTRHLESEPSIHVEVHAPDLLTLDIESTILLNSYDNLDVTLNGVRPQPQATSQAIQPITEKWLELFSDSLNEDAFQQRQPNSDWENWKKYWTRKSIHYLRTWAHVETEDRSAYGNAVAQYHELQEIARASMLRDRPQESLAVEWNAPRIEPARNDPTSNSENKHRWTSLAGCLLLLTCLVLVARNLHTALEHRPWWYMLTVGLFIWLFSGAMLPMIVLGILGLIVQVDTFWMSNERLRRTGTRGQRSP